jgi:excisionase family DNA binding protein
MKPLYVRLPSTDADRLTAAATSTGKSKRQLVGEAVRDHLGDGGMAVGRITLPEGGGEVLTLAEAAEFLRLDQAQVEKSAKQGELPARRIGGDWRFSRAAILSWLGGAEPPED